MRRRGGVSASVISEAEATSYVKKVRHLNMYNNTCEPVTILPVVEDAESDDLLIEFVLTFLGCPEGLQNDGRFIKSDSQKYSLLASR
jgi:hypothetical protein